MMRSLPSLRRSAFSVLTVAALAVPVGLQAVAQEAADFVEAEILPGWRSADGVHMAALHLRLAPGWHTYWRTPGDAGIPPSFDFTGSRNVQSVAFHWPAPKVYRTNGMAWIGYKDQLILPMEIRMRDGGGSAELAAEIDMGVCDDICVPVTVSVGATLDAAATDPDTTIRVALADRPMTPGEAGAGPVTCRLEPAGDALRLLAEVRLPSLGQGEYSVVEPADTDLWVSEASTTRSGDRLTAEVEIAPPPGRALAIDRETLRLTVLGTRGVVEFRGCD